MTSLQLEVWRKAMNDAAAAVQRIIASPPRSDWIEVDAQEFARIKGIKGFDWRILIVAEQHEEG